MATRFVAADLAKACGGEIVHGNPDTPFEFVDTDSRTARKNSLFWALDGPRYRGEDFAADAFAKGATGIACERRPVSGVSSDGVIILVKDTLRAYGDVANWWRRKVAPKVVAVSGSAGKTTTKEMLAHLCRGTMNVLHTTGNLNNLIGLPRTILDLDPSHEIAILELGMNQPGELTRLTRIAEPDFGIITNIGNAHIGNFGSQKALIAGEAEIFQTMRKDGVGILNADCPHCAMLPESFRTPDNIITFGQEKKADVRAEEIERISPYGYRFILRVLDSEEAVVTVPLYGRYQVMNVLAAAATAIALSMDIEDVARGLNSFRPPAMRSELEYLDGITVVKDCYNASPASMVESLRSLVDMHGPKRRIAFLGEMAELGAMAEHFHREAGAAAAAAKFDLLVCVGANMRHAIDEAKRAGVACEFFDSTDSAAAFLAKELRTDDVLLVKGSRVNKLERGLERLRELRANVRNGVEAPNASTVEA